ncbi:hypothetical protein VNO78_07877 [Psophocarpus tetragonolobus]|uniref:Uncharacterized protein n=1 Tax=Psophocarpus tetragonolobus TaxID=3891 RepID=A0AAN9XSU2_PSOTE
MGLHMVAMAKFHVLFGRHSIGPVVGWTVCPLAFKLFLGLRVFQQDAVYSTRLFLFRLGQIVLNREIPFTNGTRLERAFRLMRQTLTTNTTSTTTQEEQLNQDTFNTLLTITL